MRRFHMGLKFFFSQRKTCFSWSIAKFSKFVGISYSLCYIWNVNILILCKLPCILLFQQRNLKKDMIFPNSSIDANLEFLSVGLKLYFEVVSSSLRGFGIFKCCSSWTSQFFPVYDKDGKLGFLKTSLGCTSKFLLIH